MRCGGGRVGAWRDREKPQLRLTTPESDLATYTFNTHTIRHHFCPVGGCAPFGLGTDPKGVATAAVNVRRLPDLDRSGLTLKQVDGRSR